MSEFNKGGFGDDLFGSPYVLGFPQVTRGVGTSRASLGGTITGSGTARGASLVAAGVAVTRTVQPTTQGISSSTASCVRRKMPGESTSRATASARGAYTRIRGYISVGTTGVAHTVLQPLMLTHGTGTTRGASHTSGTLLKVVLPAPVSGMRIASWARRVPAADLRFQGWTARV